MWAVPRIGFAFAFQGVHHWCRQDVKVLRLPVYRVLNVYTSGVLKDSFGVFVRQSKKLGRVFK